MTKKVRVIINPFTMYKRLLESPCFESRNLKFTKNVENSVINVKWATEPYWSSNKIANELPVMPAKWWK